MIQAEIIQSRRLKQFVLRKPSNGGIPVFFIHGNASHSKIWEHFFTLFDDGFDLYAPDLRGFGQTEDLPINATLGVGDWVDDIIALADYYKLDTFNLIGHSLGGMVCFGLLAKCAHRIQSIAFLAPGSPYGYGGTKGKDGDPTCKDFSGSGAGLINPILLNFIIQNDLFADHPSSPANVIKRLYFSPDFKPSSTLIRELTEAMTLIKLGKNRYPGDAVDSPNWPYNAPGKWGPTNAISPKWNQNLTYDCLNVNPKPNLLWVHGTDDLLVSNNAVSDPGTLGALGFIPNWPGNDVYPPQPMLDQLHYFFESYSKNGGNVSQKELPKTGHCPHIEKPNEVFNTLLNFWE